MSNPLIDVLNETAKQESGGGYVCKVLLQTGYKAFAAGVGNRESFFACSFEKGKEKEREAAKAQAKTIGKPQASFQIVVYRDSIKGRDVTWQDDRFFCTPLWTQACKEIVLPSLERNGITKLGEGWARVSFAPDPSGRTKKDQNGKDAPELVAFIATVYKNEKAAEADAMGDNPESPTPTTEEIPGFETPKEPAKSVPGKNTLPIPEAWKEYPDNWRDEIGKLVEKYKGKPAPVVAKALEAEDAAHLGATAQELMAAMKAYK